MQKLFFFVILYIINYREPGVLCRFVSCLIEDRRLSTYYVKLMGMLKQGKVFHNWWVGEMIFELFLKLSLSLFFFATICGFLRSLDLFGLGRAAEYVRN